MRPELRHLYAVRWCDAEVCNGGFHQFYTNATGVLGPEAAEGFEAVGLPACAEIVRGTLAFFGAPFPRERAQRMTQLPTRGKTRAEWARSRRPTRVTTRPSASATSPFWKRPTRTPRAGWRPSPLPQASSPSSGTGGWLRALMTNT